MYYENFEVIKSQIRDLKTKLEKVYSDSAIPPKQVLQLSWELDKLIVEYHKLQRQFDSHGS